MEKISCFLLHSTEIKGGKKQEAKILLMKSMTCNQLGGACDKVFRAETFEEIAQLSKEHGREMFKIQDPDHLAAMGKMQELMKSPELMHKWFLDKKAEFEAMPED